MKTSLFRIERVLASYPEKREEILGYADQARGYSTECGCALGAKFLAAALAIFMVSLVISNDWYLPDLLRQIGLGVLFLFAASVAGKLTGLGIARIRLARLTRHLTAKYPLPGG